MTLTERWQTVVMLQTGFSNRRVADQMGLHHSVINSLMQHLKAIAMDDERPRSGRSSKTTHRENMLLARGARRNRFATKARVRDKFNFGAHVHFNM